MNVLTVNAGSHSLHLVCVEDGHETRRLDSTQPPGSAATDEAIAGFLNGHGPPDAVGHRLVHGGDRVRRPSLVDDRLRGELDRLAPLAPLHVPPALAILDTLRARLPGVPHVVCPDTAFHAGLPEAAATFPLPEQWRRRWGLRRYGFHGLSYAWALGRTAQLTGRAVDNLRVVMTHLSGGSSVCAVRDGRSLDTSMGFTPLDGVPMGTRSGAVDPGLLLWLLGTEPDGTARLSVAELEDGLNHRSGLLGLSDGRSSDTRDLVAAADADRSAALALEVFVHRVRREIAAAATSLDRLDAVVFTGEIGWDQPEVRDGVCAGLGLLGVPMPVRGNRADDGAISPEGSAVHVLVIAPREELQLAAETSTAL
ncbi:acetate/propionate family kinase [Rugosimonospora africana]|uniref:Acetate kinase n=1 Tax=Rugosimonospora africana TaxID=556532 RepID=A0A8J3R2A1_9ACTN|nr:acetate/propionate family kinase [Rugosimonospora africana]GIH20941.1 acetate kinase [Rugosimonospora africana]